MQSVSIPSQDWSYKGNLKNINIIMKAIKFFAAAAVLAMTVACNPKNGGSAAGSGADSLGVKNPEALLPTKAETDSVSYLLGVNFGSFLKNYNFGDDINYSKVIKGIKDYLNAKGDYRDSNFVKQFKISPEKMNDLFNNYLSKRREYTNAVNLKKEKEFLESNKGKDSVQVTESGLQYIIRNAGAAEKLGPKDTVFVHYVGKLTDGTVFDQTEPSQPSARLTLDRVVKGWTEGLQLIGEGGSIKLFVPSALGYGENGTQGIEPNSTLVFDVQVDSVKRYVEPVSTEVKK